jgi:hypothetical protein
LESNKPVAFYADRSTGWVAQPKHGKDGFAHAGRFKKAPSASCSPVLSLTMEKHFAALIKAVKGGCTGRTVFPEGCALEMAAEQTFDESNCKHRPWACNGSQCALERSRSSCSPERGVHRPGLRQEEGQYQHDSGTYKFRPQH